jgi:hypothetical protein
MIIRIHHNTGEHFESFKYSGAVGLGVCDRFVHAVIYPTLQPFLPVTNMINNHVALSPTISPQQLYRGQEAFNQMRA